MLKLFQNKPCSNMKSSILCQVQGSQDLSQIGEPASSEKPEPMTYGMLLGSLRLYINKIKHFVTSFCCHTDMHSQFYKEVCSCAISNKIQKCQVSKKHQNGSISTTPEEGIPITPFKEEAAHTGRASAPASVLWSSFLLPALLDGQPNCMGCPGPGVETVGWRKDGD